LADSFIERESPPNLDCSNTYRELGETLPSLGLAYLLTEDQKYLKGAEKWIEALLDLKTWEGSENLGRSAWVTGIAQVYDWLYHAMDDKLKKRITSRLKEEAEIIKNTAMYTRALSNHLLIETSAIGTVGLILPENDPDRSYFLEQSNQWMEYIINNAPLDGSWGEGVQYWQYGLSYYLRYLIGAETSEYYNYFKDYNWLKKTGKFLVYFSVPDKLTRVINFGDCGSNRYIPPCIPYTLAGKYNDAIMQNYALEIQETEPHKLSWFDFLTYDSSVNPVDHRNVLDEFHHFKDNGFVTMRSSWDKDATLLGFRCGPGPGHANQEKPERLENNGYGPGHQHPDINSFVVYSNGTWLAIDPGYSGLKETRNHNTILINSKGQAGAGGKWLDYMAFQNREPAPKITYTESNPNYDYVIGNAGNIYVDEAGLENFERQLMVIKPNIIVVADRLKAKENSDYTWLLHANEIASIEKNEQDYLISKDKASLSVFPVWPENLSSSEVTERELAASDVRGYKADSQIKPTLKTIKLHTNGVQTNFVVVLIANKPGDKKPEVSMKGNLIHILSKNGNYKINYEPANNHSEKVLELED
jgi:hypothetical protein